MQESGRNIRAEIQPKNTEKIIPDEFKRYGERTEVQ